MMDILKISYIFVIIVFSSSICNARKSSTPLPFSFSKLRKAEGVNGSRSGGPNQISSRFSTDGNDENDETLTFYDTFEDENGDNYEGDDGYRSEKDALYEAYNLLHTLAQDFQKPFDAPAVVVVGHQSSGKSALIEALMGFQFNQVGGGTKTRRPIALHMQYNPQCEEPRCFLQGEDGVERPKSLAEIQDYIQSENERLEQDPVRSFDSREINLRIEYKYSPNMILIDTPGLISAPRSPRSKTAHAAAGVSTNTQQRALLASAREAERLVVSKMRCQDYIILCVEDTMDWKHGATREVVQKADPDLSRTVIVNTKLETKIPQFGASSDISDFLRAEIIDHLCPHRLGGPFFTSVPSGRVGRTMDIAHDFLFDNDDDFVESCADTEATDRNLVEERLNKYGREETIDSTEAMANSEAKDLLSRVGLSHLRTFLERRVDECYRRNVAKILPVLQADHASAERRLETCENELDALSVARLKAAADDFCDVFCDSLKEAVQGNIIAPPDLFGETIQQEGAAAGSFIDVPGSPLAVSSRTWDRLVASEVGNKNHRLYGGSQYHRAIREFNLATRCLRPPTITEDEIANAAGVGDTHDGVNFLRASCVIALEKARTSFDPLLDVLRSRTNHIMAKLYSVSEYMLRQRQDRASSRYASIKRADVAGGSSSTRPPSDLTQNPQFRDLVRTIFENFIQTCSNAAMQRCEDDLAALTRFVTWDLHERSGGALRRSLPDQTDIVSVYQVAVEAAKNGGPTMKGKNDGVLRGGKILGGSSTGVERRPTNGGVGPVGRPSAELTPIEEGSVEHDYINLLQLMEEAACSRDANRTNLVVGGLVQHIVAQWRETFGRSVTTKFNCYFLLPFMDEFHSYLRKELLKVYEGEGDRLCEVFDLTAARKSLQQQREELINECNVNKRLQQKFHMVAKMMRKQSEKESNDGTNPMP